MEGQEGKSLNEQTVIQVRQALAAMEGKVPEAEVAARLIKARLQISEYCSNKLCTSPPVQSCRAEIDVLAKLSAMPGLRSKQEDKETQKMIAGVPAATLAARAVEDCKVGSDGVACSVEKILEALDKITAMTRRYTQDQHFKQKWTTISALLWRQCSRKWQC